MTTNRDELHENGAQQYPETLRILVGGADEAFDHAIKQAGADGVPDEAVRSFERVADPSATHRPATRRHANHHDRQPREHPRPR